MYYQYEEPVKKCAGHRVLALNRGEKEKVLTVKIDAPEETILRYLEKQIITRDNPYTAPVLREVAADSYRRLIAPAIEREIRSALTETAEAGAIKIFGKNLKQLLMQPPAGIRRSVPAVSWLSWMRPARCWIPPLFTRLHRRIR